MIEYKVKVCGYKTEWYNLQGKLHRIDGPAVEYADGDKAWYLNGQLHREDGPATEGNNEGNRYKQWWINGHLHRVDGPAVEWCNGYKEWYIDGQQLTEEEFNNKNKKQ